MAPQKRQDQNSWGMSLSPHVVHAHPTEVSIGRIARHASHCKAKPALIKVQTGQVHCPSADDSRFGVFPARLGPEVGCHEGPDFEPEARWVAKVSSPSFVKSIITLSTTLDLAALAASRKASDPDPQTTSSRFLRSAALGVLRKTLMNVWKKTSLHEPRVHVDSTYQVHWTSRRACRRL